jgi:uncharacterized protein YdeI (YjbR/CyaY-like superfamily)
MAKHDEPRELIVPEELSDALAADDLALAVFERLSFSHRREHANYVADAKNSETRQRRADETVKRLRSRA